MIGRDEAEAVARAALAARVRTGDPLLKPWREIAVGAAVAVYDVAGPQSYWLAPLVAGDQTVGFVRVGLNGEIEALGITCRGPTTSQRCPPVASGTEPQEALARARDEGGLAAGEQLAPPRLVHDGPHGREAWLVESTIEGRPYRWFFVTPTGLYIRPAGVRHSEDPFLD